MATKEIFEAARRFRERLAAATDDADLTEEGSARHAARASFSGLDVDFDEFERWAAAESPAPDRPGLDIEEAYIAGALMAFAMGMMVAEGRQASRKAEADLDDPRRAGGDLIDVAGDPHAKGGVVFDARRAILAERIEVATAEVTRGGEPAPDIVAMVIEGRINRPADDRISRERPAESVRHLHMLSWEAAADVVVDIQALAGRAGFELTPLLEEKWADLVTAGLTTARSEASGG